MENTMEILTKSLIKETIIGAIEGASNYWYYLPDESVNTIRKYVSKEENEYISEALVEAIYRGAKVVITDVENPYQILGTLSIKNINKGLNKMNADNRHELNDIRIGHADADTYDVIFQYMVLGEIVFG